MTGRSPFRSLETVRDWLSQGKINRALRLLDAAVQRGPEDVSEWMEFLVPAIRIALLHQRQEWARRWIDGTLRKIKKLSSRPDSNHQHLVREIGLLKLWVRFSERGLLGIEGKVEKAFSGISRWKPWMVHFRWMVLLNQHRMKELEDLIRRPPACSIPRGSLEYATRLYCLGLRFALDLRLQASLILLQSALKKLDELSIPEAIDSRSKVLCWLARLYIETGQFCKALQHLKAGDALCQTIKTKAFLYLRGITYARLYYCQGEYEKAMGVHLNSCLSSPKRPYDVQHSALAFLHAAQCALKIDHIEEARSLVARARPLVKRFPHVGLLGSLHLVSGDLEAISDTPRGKRKAWKHYERAERVFRSRGSGHYQWWLCQLYISRGALCLKEKNVAGVLHQASLSMELGKKIGVLDCQAEGLLLKSFLLLEKEAPRAELYETILRNLGVVKEPVVLFKILANLYIYSWDLGDQLELTDLHLKQIERLRENMLAPLYQRLYQTYVTARVVARFKSRFACSEAGQSLPPLDPPEGGLSRPASG